MISDEQVRGRIAPRWLGALSGLERLQLYSNHKIPTTPMGRLVGWRVPHVGPGMVTMTMPASPTLGAPNGQLVIAHLCLAALHNACESGAAPGTTFVPLACTINALRPVRALPGNLLARARVMNASRYFSFAEVQVEDSEGRSISQATLHAARTKIVPPPTKPPAEIPHIGEAVYDTADPYLRRVNASTDYVAAFAERPGIDVLRDAIADGAHNSISDTFSISRVACDTYWVECTMVASEWYCNAFPHIDAAALGAFLEYLMWMGAATMHRPGDRFVALYSIAQFLGTTAPDGRLLHGKAEARELGSNRITATTTITDADGKPLATGSTFLARLSADDAGSRRSPQRALLTLLFSDIVESTERARVMGDAAWTAVLEAHYASVRRELARYSGTEVATAGDGFFARFDSPAQALEAARAIRRAAAQQQIHVRIGLHTGECEIDSNRLSGIAVHTAARILAAAGPDEILVSSTVHELTRGGGGKFTDRGEFALKGLAEKWRLYALAD